VASDCSRCNWLSAWTIDTEGWCSIGHEPFTALEQWKASRHRSLWLVVSNRDVVNQDTPDTET